LLLLTDFPLEKASKSNIRTFVGPVIFFKINSAKMTIFTSKKQPIAIPNIDIYSFLFQPNEFNTTRSQDRPLLIDGISGKSLTFKQVRTISGQLATGWKENVGLKKGDVVAVFAPNQYDHAVLYFSLIAAQCIVTPGNPNYTEGTIIKCMHCIPKQVF